MMTHGRRSAPSRVSLRTPRTIGVTTGSSIHEPLVAMNRRISRARNRQQTTGFSLKGECTMKSRIVLSFVSVFMSGMITLPAISQSIVPSASSRLAHTVDEGGGESVVFVGSNQHVYQISYNLG